MAAAAAVEPSLLREREWADGLKRAADDLAAEIVELATTLEDERPAATRADTAAAAAAARAHDAQARRGDVVDAAVTWSKN